MRALSFEAYKQNMFVKGKFFSRAIDIREVSAAHRIAQVYFASVYQTEIRIEENYTKCKRKQQLKIEAIVVPILLAICMEIKFQNS